MKRNCTPLQTNTKGHREQTFSTYQEGKYITNWYCVICGNPIKWDECYNVFFPRFGTHKDTCEDCWARHTTDDVFLGDIFIDDIEPLRKANANFGG